MDKKKNPFCPFCNKEVKVEDIETQLLYGAKNTSKGGIMEKILTTTTKVITIVYICPHCRKILGFSN